MKLPDCINEAQGSNHPSGLRHTLSVSVTFLVNVTKWLTKTTEGDDFFWLSLRGFKVIVAWPQDVGRSKRQRKDVYFMVIQEGEKEMGLWEEVKASYGLQGYDLK